MKTKRSKRNMIDIHKTGKPGMVLFLLIFLTGLSVPLFAADQKNETEEEKGSGSIIDTVEAQKVTMILSLESYIRLAAAADRTFQNYLIEGAKAKYSAVLQAPSEDIVVSAGLEYGLNFLNPSKNDGISGNVGVSKLFASTGTELAGEAAFSEKNLGLSFSVGQDIVKNAFGREGRWQKELAGISRDLAEYQTIEAYEDYFAQVAGEWYQWVSLYRALENSKLTYNESLMLYNLVARKRQSGIASQADLNRSYLQLISANSDIIAAQEAFDSQELIVKLSAGLDPDQPIVPDTTGPFPFKGEFPSINEKPLSKDYSDLIAGTRTGKMIELLNRTAGLDLKIARNDLLPSVKLNVGYDLLSGNDFDFSSGTNGMTLGLSLSYPVWSKQARAAYEIARLEEEQNAVTVADTEAKLAVDLRQLHLSITSLTRRLELAKQKVTLQEQIYNETNAQYNTGRADLNDLVSEIQSLSQQRYALSLLNIELEQLQLEWLRLTDSLVTESDVLTGE